MRNLKKVLSLVLALAMVLSLCMVGASAVNYDDFTDEESITKKQAVETLVSLDVIKGYNDGATFNPTGNVTRAEMATMICRILAGGDNMIVDATKPVPTYTDVRNNPSAAWAESYIEYCTSLGIVSGKGNGIFDPSADVTAAEAAKMVMTTLGYNADIEGFKGIGWDINVMAKANTLQLLDNLQGEISSSVPVTREQVAQLLFNALSAYTVQNYNGTTANTWIGSGAEAYHETLLESKFNAEKIVGVVVANEWADLYDTEPLAAGKTRVRVLGTDNMPTKQEYTVNLTTSLEQVGESIIVYRDTKSNRILFGNDQSTDMNVVNEFTAKGDITKGSDFENAIDKNALTKDTEYFINYDIGYETTSEYKIKYVVKCADASQAQALKDENEDLGVKDDAHKVVDVTVYERSISKGSVFTSADLANIQRIFDIADKVLDGDKEKYVDGEVYVGTQSTKDASDTMSWKEFEEEYLKTDLEKAKNTQNENGNYIKTVDYNKDGEIDFVLKTIYSVTNVDSIRDDEIKLYLDDVTEPVNVKKLVKSICAYDELTKDDIVVYACIDGIAHTYLSNMVTAKIDKVNRNKLTCTTTDGDEYEQSGVNQYIDEDLEFDDGVRSLAGSTSYDLYFDRYGYLAAFTQTETAGNFTLLVDGWYNVQRGGTEYAVLAWNEGKLVDTDVSRKGELFIGNDDSLNNSWNQLKYFGGNTKALNGDDNYAPNAEHALRTTVASLSEDGILSPVDQVYNKKSIRMIATDDNVIPKKDYVGGDAYVTTSGAKTAYNDIDRDTKGVDIGSDVEVRGLSSTVYYYVYNGSNTNNNSAKKDVIVKEYVGYSKAPAVKADEVEDVYVVATQARRSSGLSDQKTYYTANVVVVELTSDYRANVEQVFIYDLPEVGNNVTIEYVDVVRENGEKQSVKIDFSKSPDLNGSYKPANDKQFRSDYNYGLYYMWETSEDGIYVVDRMSREEIAANNYTVGQIVTTDYTSDEDWFEVLAFTWDNDTSEAGNNLLSDVAGMTDTEYRTAGKTGANPDTPQYTLTDSSKVWSLSYEWKNDDYIADLRDGAAKSILAERTNTSTDVKDADNRDTDNSLTKDPGDKTVYFDHNDVLVRYNKDGNVVYAISFANDAKPGSTERYTWDEDGDGIADNRDGNLAQFIWDNVKPAGKKVEKIGVTFFGQTDWIGPNADATTKDKDADAKVIEVDYTDAKKHGNEGSVNVTNVDYWLLTGPDGKTVKKGMAALADAKTTDATYTLSFIDEKGELQNYTLILDEADHDSDLWYTAGKVNEDDWVQVVPDEWEYTGINNTLTNIMKEFKLKTGSTAEDPKWTFYAANGTEITNTNTSVLKGYYAKVVVTSEDGYDRVYTIYFGTDDDFLDGAMNAIDNKAFDVYFNGANGKITFFGNEADAEQNDGDSYIFQYNTGTFGTTANQSEFIQVARWIAGQWLTANGYGGLDDPRLEVLYTSAVNAGGGAASVLNTAEDDAQTWVTYTLRTLKSAGGTNYATAGIVVRMHYVNLTTRNYGQAAKDLVDGMTPQVYYSEWHAMSTAWDGTTTPKNYDKNGAAEYLSRDEAANLVKPNGTTIFDLSDGSQTVAARPGEGAAVATVNKALEDAGNELHIVLEAGRYGAESWANWGTKGGTAPTRDVTAGDTYTRTATYALVDDNNCDSGLTVTITWTTTAVVGAWNDGHTYFDTVPADYWQ